MQLWRQIISTNMRVYWINTWNTYNQYISNNKNNNKNPNRDRRQLLYTQFTMHKKIKDERIDECLLWRRHSFYLTPNSSPKAYPFEFQNEFIDASFPTYKCFLSQFKHVSACVFVVVQFYQTANLNIRVFLKRRYCDSLFYFAR